MFLLFFNLYYSMFIGEWDPYSTLGAVNSNMKFALNHLGKLITSIFGDNVSYATFGDDIIQYLVPFVAYILALITSIGIVVMAVKGIKKVFGVFFMGIR